MTYLKKIFKSIAYTFLVLLVSLCIYTFVVTDIMKKDYVNVFGYTYFVVKTGSMSGTLEVDDIIIVKLSKDANLNDIITYVNDDGEIITHRLVRKVSGKLIAQGDVNNAEDNPITNDQLVGVVKLAISPSFILKLVATFLILFIFLALINFDNIIQKYIIKEKKKVVSGTVPEEIFVTKEHKKEEKSGLTVTIPLNEIANIEKAQEKEIESEEEIEILEVEDVIDIDNNSIVTKERNTARERERELLEQISNLLRIKNDSLTTTRINKKWLTKYQYVYKLALIVNTGDLVELEEAINHPTFKEIYDYDLDRAGLYENLRNKIYDMPIYIFLRILTFAILYNDEEFFDGIYKIMKYKIQIDKLGYFKEVKKNDTYGRKQLKSLITFMQKIPMKFDNKNVFELERIEKYVKLKSYVNN
ncbi:MAG: S24/S26 family peptidase [Tenericutes bacterium]|nr:S24/S26 family peptidase [Mycoplasmatota bacterium]MDD6941463.1 S24/S26 family peptidase [bacterium]MDY2696986.1 S24/S26 family peptidase [Bacilli bacterium]